MRLHEPPGAPERPDREALSLEGASAGPPVAQPSLCSHESREQSRENPHRISGCTRHWWESTRSHPGFSETSFSTAMLSLCPIVSLRTVSTARGDEKPSFHMLPFIGLFDV